MAEPLASAEDVAAVLGRDLTFDEYGKVDAILLKASELFRRESGQQFTAGSSVARIKVNGGTAYLPQRPVVEIESVIDDCGSAVEYEQTGNRLTVALSSPAFITVDYSHGGDVPDLVRLAIAEIVKKTLLVDSSAEQGVTQQTETTGSMSESKSFAAWAIGGQTSLSPEDKALAKSYRFRPPRVHVMVP